MVRHFGEWMVEPDWFREAVRAFKAGELEPVAQTPRRKDSTQYSKISPGIALLEVSGQMQKGGSKFGGTNTVEMRRSIRAAANDDDIKGLMIFIDSPGGTAAGTAELAKDIKEFSQMKPVHVHIEDMGASAAYWIASQADHITATETSWVGSVGVIAVVEDDSEAYEKAGIKVHIITTGKYKTAGAPGKEVTKDDLKYFQSRVDEYHERFVSDIAEGRRLTRDEIDDFADGRVFMARRAQELGMIDGVARIDEAIAILRNTITEREKTKAARTKIAKASISMAEAELDGM